jgi:tetratricopeptide (TPR) repeat protein
MESVRRYAIVLLIMAGAAAATSLGQTAKTPAAHAEAESRLDPAVAAAEAAIVKQEWKTAEEKLAAYLAGHGTDARALFDAGYVADAENKPEDAAGFYERAVTADPASFEARLELGLVLARLGKLDEARPQLDAATKLDPGDAGAATKARAWRALARIDRDKDPAQASNDLLEALNLTPETARDTLLAAELAEATDQQEAAEKAYRRVLAEEPKNAEAAAGLAHVLMVRKQYAEAETVLRAALEQAPGDPALTAELATALAAQDKGEALPLLEKLHEAHPQDENVTRMLAEVTAESGDAAGSDKLYALLLAAHPKDAGLLAAHGQNLLRQLKYPEALQAFSRVTELNPQDGDSWGGLAFAASKTGQPSITLHALTMRSRYLAENPSTLFLWATSYDKLRAKEQAAAYYHQFLESSGGKFPDQEWQARQRLIVLEKKP